MREIFFAALLLQVLMTSSAGRRMRRDLTMSTEKRPGRNYFTEDPEDSGITKFAKTVLILNRCQNKF